MQPTIEQLQAQIEQLRQDLAALNAEYYTNNFTTHQDYNKTVYFNTRLKVPHYASDPATAEVGELIEVGGKLKICATANNFVVVGGQS